MDFAVGTRVRLIHNPSVIGRTTGETMGRAGRVIVEVDVEGRGPEFYPIDALEACAERPSHLADFQNGRFSGPADLAAVITLEKLRGELTDLIYSMRAGRTKFYPHQFKPVLKFVQANVGRILIADEVGLGKTIEAIYLWKELQVRDQARRLLVVCPSMLKEKWRRDLDNLFAIEATIVDAKGLLEALRRAERNEATPFALIAGLEGCRPPARFREASGTRAELARILDASPASEEAGLIDLTVIDEAHYLRNPETRSHRLGGLLRDASRRLALLTATPIQIHAENLFQLLNLVDPEDYANAYEFGLRRTANAPIIAASALFRRSGANRSEAVAALDACLAAPLFANDMELARLREKLHEIGELDAQTRIDAARMLEERSLIGRHMTRSRKRDVLEERVQRSATSLNVVFTDIEKGAYHGLTAYLRARAAESWTGKMSGVTLGIITRQRQMASSLPAALAAWRERKVIDEQLWDDLGLLAQGEEGEEEVDLGLALPSQIDMGRLEAADSKYGHFRAAVQSELGRDPAAKMVTFAFFRDTLSYLQRRLTADGISSSLLMGGMENQQGIIDAFAAPGGASVLLSSEVASEGVDLQFARVLVNYDLPWNPMRLEQRIGRLDRLGQQAEKISIINLYVAETIEERMLHRLYDRIKIFEESIGDLEPILGEISERLLMDVMDPNLSEAERQRKADQTLSAVAEQVSQTRVLEEEAQHLLGLNDFLLGQITAKEKLGEWIRPDDIRRFIIDAFARAFFSSRLETVAADPDFFRLRLCPAARTSLLAYLDVQDPGGRARALLNPTTLFLCDPEKIRPGRRGGELVDAGHLLIRWLRTALDIEGLQPHAVSAGVATAGEDGPPSGLWVFAVQARKLAGLRREAVMETCAFRLGDATPRVGAEASVIRRAAESAAPYNPSPRETEAAFDWVRKARELLSERALDRAEIFRTENDRLCDQRASAAQAFRDRRVADIQRTIDEVTGDPVRASILPVLRQRMAAQDDELAVKLGRIGQARRVTPSIRPVALGLLRVEG